MLVETYKEMLQGKSVIRQLSEFANARGREIGYENVFDYSLGNPSVAVPDQYGEVLIDLVEQMDPIKLHGYSPSLGLPSVKEKIAKSLEQRFSIPYKAEHIFPVSGAASALAHAIRAVVEPGEEVIIFAPYFPEYIPYIKQTGAEIKIVPAKYDDFQMDFAALEAMIGEKTSAILLNSPNNPSGTVYTTQTIKLLAQLLDKKSKEIGREFYIISDEPYREIVFGGVDNPCISQYYDNTLVCYSFSKSLSLPGERIGYIAVNPKALGAELLVPMFGQISRGIGHNCPSSLIQLSVAECLELTADLSVYETNQQLIYHCLVELGFTVVKPGGTFYIFPKALEEDANIFCEKALLYDLVLVPGDSFGCPGYFRMAYCIDTDKVLRSLDALRRFVDEIYRNN